MGNKKNLCVCGCIGVKPDGGKVVKSVKGLEGSGVKSPKKKQTKSN
jgi:hypothetical protein